MWYYDTILTDTNYCAILTNQSDTKADKGLFTGWIDSRTLDFEIAHNWGEPPSNPITGIARAVAGALNSAQQTTDAFKNQFSHLIGTVSGVANTTGLMSDDTAAKVTQAAENTASMFMNSGRIVVPAGEYYKTYQGTNFTTPRLSITTLFINDTCEEALSPMQLTNPYSKKTLSEILTSMLPEFDEKDKTGTGLFITMTAPGGYKVPAGLKNDVEGAFKLVWGGTNDPVYLDNLLIENISLSKSASFARVQVKEGSAGRNTGQKQPLYVRMTCTLIPARAYTKETFVKTFNGGK